MKNAPLVIFADVLKTYKSIYHGRKDNIKTIPIKLSIHGKVQVKKFEREMNLNIKNPR